MTANGYGISIFFLLFRCLFVAAASLHWCARLPPATAAEGYSLVAAVGASLQWLLLLWSTGCKTWASVVVAHGRSCLAACGISPDQGLNPCLLPSQADS